MGLRDAIRKMNRNNIESIRKKHPMKFVSTEAMFSKIKRGDHVFIGSGCGEPQKLLSSFVEYMRGNPKAVSDLEFCQLWDIGTVPYGDESLRDNFRHNSFFIGRSIRDAVNKGLADYTPLPLSEVPDLFQRRVLQMDVALVQVSYPNERGFVSLGVNCDITRAGLDSSDVVIAQMNKEMPYVKGDGLVHIDDLDYIFPYDEPLIEYSPAHDKEVVASIGKSIAGLIHDGETIELGYGGLLSAAAAYLKDKKHLGVHTELLSDGIVELMKCGAVDNTRKTIDKGKTVASFCMGRKTSFDYINDNPLVELKSVSYTDNPLVIAKHEHMTAINTALAIDLTGQASEESAGCRFYGGIGGQSDYMRGAALARSGKSILVLESTSDGGETSRIVPFLPEGAGVTLNRGDVHYVVTEYGIAYLHGKSVRERAMELIAIAHPKFRQSLLEEAKKHNLVYRDQSFVPGKSGEYPKELESYRTTKKGVPLFLRPVKISDEEMLKDFFYSLSEDSMYHRFVSARMDMPHERLQEFTVIDYSKQLVILAIEKDESGKESVVGVGQYGIDDATHTAEAAFAVRDDRHNMGIGKELLECLTKIAKRKGILGFTAEVLSDNKPMMTLFEEMGFDLDKELSEGVYHYKMIFRRRR